MTKLKTYQLSDGKFVVPADSWGTCGFHPKAWIISKIAHKGFGYYETPTEAFLRCNENWSMKEISHGL